MLQQSYGLVMNTEGDKVKVMKIGNLTFIDDRAYEDIKDTLHVGDIIEVLLDEPYNIPFDIYGLECVHQVAEAKMKSKNSTKRYNMLINKVIKRQDGKNKALIVANPLTKNEMKLSLEDADEIYKTKTIREGDIVGVEVFKLPAKTKYESYEGIYVLPKVEGELLVPMLIAQKPLYFYKIGRIEATEEESLLKLKEDSKEGWEEVAIALEAAAAAVKIKEKLTIKETSLSSVSLEWKVTRSEAIGTYKSRKIMTNMVGKVAQKFVKGVKVKLSHEDCGNKYALAKINETWHTKNSIGFSIKIYPTLIYNMLDTGYSQEIESKGWSMEIPPDFAIPTKFIPKIRGQTLPMFRNQESGATKEIVKALLSTDVEAGKNRYKKISNKKLEPFLTVEQKEVLAAALNPNIRVIASESVAGSGKSKTLTIIARELLKNDQEYAPVLLCASTNVAVRHLLTEVVKETESIVGNSILFLPSLCALRNATPAEKKICTKFSLYNRLMDLIKDGIEEPEKGIVLAAANILQENIDKMEEETSDDEEDKSVSQQVSDIKKVEKAFQILLSKKTPMIIAATLSMANRHARNLKDYIQCGIFDEAATMTMIETLAFISEASKLKKMIFMGDSKQLSSHDLGVPDVCKKLGFASALEHVYAATGDGLKLTKLTNTFRFTKQIAQFVTELCYDGELKMGIEDDDAESSLLFVNCKGTEERLFPISRTNKLQNLVAKQVIEKVRLYNQKCSVAILTYYNGQRNELKAILTDKSVEICSVDSFQGREADIVIIVTTLVDNKSDFVDDKQRLCVALTRAKKGIIIIGHAATLEKMKNWKAVVGKMKELNKICTPQEMDEDNKYLK
uniref:Uncharacterized protein n=1 Tax=Panagrolaimus sp. ES5 TaxID=591445 RepID=A0AC34FT34_9BILA